MNPQQMSKGSDEDPRYANMDEKTRKRKKSNRDSARRSRMKKQQQQVELISQVSKLQSENAEIAQKINVASQMYVVVESENNVLRARMMELSDRLQSLNSVLQGAEEVRALAMDVSEFPDAALMEPWQFPCPMAPIMANFDSFEF